MGNSICRRSYTYNLYLRLYDVYYLATKKEATALH
jgi:hypothetical protein